MTIKIKIRYQQSKAQDFIIFVNPKTIIPGGDLWTELYPIAWKVAQFGGSGGNDDFEKDFTLERTVGVNTFEEGVLTKIGSHHSVGQNHKGNKFKLTKDGNTYGLALDSDPNSEVSAEIFNEFGQLDVYYGDKSGAPLISSKVSKDKSIAFKETTEIVIAAVSNYQDKQLLKSEMRGAWISFLVRDAESHDNQIFVEFNSTDQYVNFGGSTTPFTQHAANVDIFKTVTPEP